MKKFKSLAAIITGVIVSASLFSGCSNDESTLLLALKKNGTITSAQSATTLSANINAVNQTAAEKKDAKEFIETINGSSISINSDFVKKDSSLQSKTDVSLKSDLSNGSLATVWMDNSVTNGKAYEKSIYKLSDMIKYSADMPEKFAKKTYMTVDTNDIAKLASEVNEKENAPIQQFTENTRKKLIKFVQDYIQNYNPGVTAITYKGEQDGLKNYELKIDNTQLKSILLYSATKLGKDTETADLLKGIVKDYVALEGLSSKETKKEIDEANADIDNALKYLSNSDGKLGTAIDKIALLGPKGIDINFYVNNEGYLTKTNGTVEIVLDMKKLTSDLKAESGAVDDATIPSYTGQYTVDLNFSNELTNINQSSVAVTLPALTKSNSYSLTEYNKYTQEQQRLEAAKTIANRAIKSKNKGVINSAILTVKALPNSTEKTKLLNKLNAALYSVNKTDASKLVKKAKKSLAIADYEKATAAINKLTKADKTKLSKDLKKVKTKVYTKSVVSAQKAINSVKKHNTKANISAAKKAISKVKGKANRDYLTKQLNKSK
ncbi:hypothetical protein [Clostridium oryzae]|uniref:Minor extracellular protease Epr n=1 Tax=Clostridium oryzae TaxID=1450648 RepID=A0A1V4I9Z7_9CLOT|nr:hypothetical protein [Clostridium oryzae]OPJ56704.1 minor extracellular protease Epr precursor [Clostridium oryzae]